MGIEITYPGALDLELGGNYTLSHGISPSIMSIDVISPAEKTPINLVEDVTFSDGLRQAVFKDCRIVDADVGVGMSGVTWKFQIQDHRWRWGFGYINGDYNYGSTDKATIKSVRELAVILLDAMDEKARDVSVLPSDEYPETHWDYDNPAQMLGDLAEQHGMLVCFDPIDLKVTLAKKGEGLDLTDDSHTNKEYTIDPPETPEKLVAVAEFTEHEVDLLLEAVGLDRDGTIKPLDELSYKPAAGWGSDLIFFWDVGITDTDDQTLASQSVYRWYRIKGGQDVYKWKSNVKLAELLPVFSKLVTTETETASDGTIKKVRKPAYVHGIHWDGIGHLKVNTAATDKVLDAPIVDEATGLIKFRNPLYKWSADAQTAVPAEPEIYLRCTVYSERHTREKEVGGIYGDKIVPCEDVVLQYVDENTVDVGVATNNLEAVNEVMDEILTAYAKRYETSGAGTATYIGIFDTFKLDGKIQQISWEVGESGAFTRVSVNSEHDFRVPTAKERRALEKSRKHVMAKMPAPAKKVEKSDKKPKIIAEVGDAPGVIKTPMRVPIYNNAGMTIPQFSLVEVESLHANGYYSVKRPTADSITGNLLITGPVPLADEKYGFGSAPGLVPVTYAGSAPSVGDEMGTATDDFELTAAKTGFKVVGVSGGLAAVVPFSPVPLLYFDDITLVDADNPDKAKGELTVNDVARANAWVFYDSGTSKRIGYLHFVRPLVTSGSDIYFNTFWGCAKRTGGGTALDVYLADTDFNILTTTRVKIKITGVTEEFDPAAITWNDQPDVATGHTRETERYFHIGDGDFVVRAQDVASAAAAGDCTFLGGAVVCPVHHSPYYGLKVELEIINTASLPDTYEAALWFSQSGAADADVLFFKQRSALILSNLG